MHPYVKMVNGPTRSYAVRSQAGPVFVGPDRGLWHSRTELKTAGPTFRSLLRLSKIDTFLLTTFGKNQFYSQFY